ncbi:MAG: DUF2141 domain-containing protein [Alphaproteobacteria bacterium]|jgi:uncharacterized protein (DUF2141 family)
MLRKEKLIGLMCLTAAMIGGPSLTRAADVAEDAGAVADTTPATEMECLGTPSDTRVIIDVENVRSADGVIRFTVYSDDEGRFLQAGGPIDGLSHLPTPAVTSMTEACLWLPGPGGYALSIFHDANDSGGMDESWLGLPAEGFGFSNNPRLFGRPKLEQVLFEVPAGDLTINIRLRYI